MHAPLDDLLPSLLHARNGKLRQVGVEIEFLGPSARTSAEALARDLGGDLVAEDPHAYKVRGSRVGDLGVDLDLRYVHPQRHPGLGFGMGNGRGVSFGARGAAWLGVAASPVVPRELITAPLPFGRLHEMDDVVASLRGAGARGRGTILLDALSLHFNIDPPGLDSETVTAYLKAFLLLERRFRRDIARGSRWLARVLPPQYPDSYVRRVLAPDYWPDLTRSRPTTCGPIRAASGRSTCCRCSPSSMRKAYAPCCRTRRSGDGRSSTTASPSPFRARRDGA
jgi:hypothetical protein